MTDIFFGGGATDRFSSAWLVNALINFGTSFISLLGIENEKFHQYVHNLMTLAGLRKEAIDCTH